MDKTNNLGAHESKYWRFPYLHLIGAGVILLIWGIGAPFLLRAQARARQRLTTARFQEVALGLHHFQETYNHLPHPTIHKWNDGEAVYSWRGRVQPYIFHT